MLRGFAHARALFSFFFRAWGERRRARFQTVPKFQACARVGAPPTPCAPTRSSINGRSNLITAPPPPRGMKKTKINPLPSRDLGGVGGSRR